jgi:Phage integrase, N-terminal SAM-like domain
MTSHATTVPSVPDLVFTDQERLALAGFLAGHRGLTREAYALDLRQFVAWCERQGLKLFSTRRTDIELYARALEDSGRARATVARRLCTVAGFYRYAEEEGLVPCHRQFTSGALAWTTSPTPWAWTVTKSVPCLSPPASGRRSSTPSSPCWP